MYNTDEYLSLIKSRLSEYRFTHSVNVAKSAVELAEKYGADKEKAYVAGILHDVMKEENLDVQREFIEKNGEKMTSLELNSKSIYHQMSGSAYAKIELHIDDEDILNAIRYHTTGRKNMSLLEKVIFTADFISAERNYPDVDIMREKAKVSLDDAMLYSLKYTINNLTSKTAVIHPDTLECYNWIIETNFKED